MANAPVRATQVRWTTDNRAIREYESTPGKLRGFCSACGSPVYARRVAHPDWLSLRLGLIDGDPGHCAIAHFNVSEKAPWFPIVDDLPQHHGDTETS